MSDEEKPVSVKGITAMEYQLWRHHPVSKVVLQFIADKRAFLERAVIDQWVGGSLDLEDRTIRGQIIELYEIENMPFDVLAQFYLTEENGKQDS